MPIIHNDPCGGTILFETRQAAVERLARARQPIPTEPREFREFYCDRCGRMWARKRAALSEAHPEESQ